MLDGRKRENTYFFYFEKIAIGPNADLQDWQRYGDVTLFS
jgi:hypothetical protein